MGATIPFESLPHVAGKGGVLLAAKVGMGVAAAMILGHFLGVEPVKAGFFAGLSTLAVVAAINDTNGGLYMALMGRYGRPQDVAAYSVMSLESGPFITMMTLGGLFMFPWQTLLGAILPLLVGMALGNLDRNMRDFLGKAAPALIPFFAFAIGASLNLTMVWRAGLLGIALGFAILVVSCSVMFLADKISRGQWRGGAGRLGHRRQCGGGAGAGRPRQSRLCRGRALRHGAGGRQRGGHDAVRAADHGVVGKEGRRGRVKDNRRITLVVMARKCGPPR